FSSTTRLPRTSSLFPYTTLFRSLRQRDDLVVRERREVGFLPARLVVDLIQEGTNLGRATRLIQHLPDLQAKPLGCPAQVCLENLDRKSTRLNSSHVKISYAVFCL